MFVNEEAERNKEFVRAHFEEFVNRKNASVIFRNMTADFCDHDGPDGKRADAATDERMMRALYEKYPDLQVSIEDIVAENGKVACRNSWRGTDATTGKKIEFQGFVLWRLEGGKIAERWATVIAPTKHDSVDTCHPALSY